MVAKKIIAVIAEWETSSKYVKKLVEEISKETNVELEIRQEDWEFLVNYGKKDEYGGVEVPQVFLVDDKGDIKYVMGRVPLDENGNLDIEKGKKILKEAIAST